MIKLTYPMLVTIAMLATASTIVSIVGCKSGTDPAVSSVDATTQPAMAGIFTEPDKGGAQLWAENCTRCHYAPSPDRFSDAQWEVIGQHMRLRANLTGNETRKITEFLKASN